MSSFAQSTTQILYINYHYKENEQILTSIQKLEPGIVKQWLKRFIDHQEVCNYFPLDQLVD